MRTLLGRMVVTGIAVALLTLGVGWRVDRVEAQEITVMTWAGAWEEAARHKTWMEVGHDVYGTIYRKDLVPLEPKTLNDLLDPRLKGKVLSPTASYASGLWIVYASLVNGGTDRNVDPGFDYLRRLKPNLARFYTTGPEAMKLLQSGEAAVFPFALFANLRPHLGPDSQYKFVLPPGPVFTTTYSVAIASPKRKAQAQRFVDFLATAQAQALYCDKVLCIPTHPSAKAPQAAEEFRPDPARLYRPDLQLINKSLPAWDDRFKKEIQSR